jgi:D-alanyl-lipoteichoic acid acyltransferase DltB (MBOAT superfamily)
MLFNSFEFLLFFPLVAIIYFAIPKNNWRNYFLLVASYYFYMCWKPEYALLLLTSTGLTYVAANLIGGGKKYKQFYLIACIVLNLAILFFFKYYHFAAENITALMQLFGVQLHIPEMNVLLPVGISFYIFQALGYSIDVYRGDVEPEKNFFNYALFVSFFPQLVAGPIERSTNLLQQFKTKHQFDGDQAISGVNLMLWGYFLKLVVADRCAIYVDSVYNNMEYQNGGSCLLASILFCFQLYGDFAGYSYIAIGCSRVMGFKLMDNFRRPYFFSTSVQDFWKRNHISLTTWFMDYIYYPMVGSSTKLWWWCFCIFFTFFISGFWHGASWTYVVSFTIFGIYLVVCTLKERSQKRFEKKYGLKKKEWWLWLNRVVTFFLVMLALVFFRANTLADGVMCLSKIFASTSLTINDYNQMICVAMALFILFVSEYCVEYKKLQLKEANSLKAYSIWGAFLMACILLLGVYDGSQFIYFQF